jgi:hypothetical protein
MLFSKKTFFSVALSVLFFVGCSYFIELQLKVQSIIDLVGSNDINRVELVDVKVRFQMSSTSQCDKERENLSTIMSKYYKEIKESKCNTENLNTFLDVVAVTTLHSVFAKLPKDQKYMIGLTLEKRGSSVDILMNLDKDKFAALNKEIKDKYMQDLKLENVKLSIHLYNNSAATSFVRVYHAFVDDKPFPSFGDFSLEPEKSLSIQVSDVTKQYVNDNGFRRVLEIRQLASSGNRSDEKKDGSKNQTGEDKKTPTTSGQNLSDDDSIIVE